MGSTLWKPLTRAAHPMFMQPKTCQLKQKGVTTLRFRDRIAVGPTNENKGQSNFHKEIQPKATDLFPETPAVLYQRG